MVVNNVICITIKVSYLYPNRNNKPRVYYMKYICHGSMNEKDSKYFNNFVAKFNIYYQLFVLQICNLSYQELGHNYQKACFVQVLKRLFRVVELNLLDDNLTDLSGVSFPV